MPRVRAAGLVFEVPTDQADQTQYYEHRMVRSLVSTSVVALSIGLLWKCAGRRRTEDIFVAGTKSRRMTLLAHHLKEVDNKRVRQNARRAEAMLRLRNNPDGIAALVRPNTDFETEQFAAFLREDSDRVKCLLEIANAAWPAEKAMGLAQRGCQAYKLETDAETEAELAGALAALSHKVNKRMHGVPATKESPGRTAVQQALNEYMEKKRAKERAAKGGGRGSVAKGAGRGGRGRGRDVRGGVSPEDGYVHGRKGHMVDVQRRGGRKAKPPENAVVVPVPPEPPKVEPQKEPPKPSYLGALCSKLRSWLSRQCSMLKKRLSNIETETIILFSVVQGIGLLYALYSLTFTKMREVLTEWVLLARGQAAVTLVTTFLMLMLMSRSLLTTIRMKVTDRGFPITEGILDKHVQLHKSLAMMLVFASILHVIGHMLGPAPALVNDPRPVVDTAFTNGDVLYTDIKNWGTLLSTWPIVSGIVLLVILLLFCVLSYEKVRRKKFENFHYMHLVLTSLWVMFLVAHGAYQWLGMGVPVATFICVPPAIWYGLERARDIWFSCHPAIHLTGAIVKDQALIINIATAGSQYRSMPGMYCMIRVRQLSEWQWHPFTVASVGVDGDIRLIIAVAGDWTASLRDLLLKCKADAEQMDTDTIWYPEINVRGGYGAPAARIGVYPHTVLVGAGVGITPFMCFLSDLCSAAKGEKINGLDLDKLQTCRLYWVTRDPQDFAWINPHLQIIAADKVLKEKVTIRLCLTGSWNGVSDHVSEQELAIFWKAVEVAASEHGKVARLLGMPTKFGRPNWKEELKEFGKEVGEGSAHIFVCGNSMLVNSIVDAAEAAELDPELPNVDFALHAEEF